MIIKLDEEKTYIPGPGQCIYCWSKSNQNGRLTREHIIAHKLGGKLVLHNASCDDCAKLINKFIETPALQQMWKNSRVQLALPSSRPSSTLRIGRWTDNGEELPQNFDGLNFRFEYVPTPDQSFSVMMAHLPPPGLLAGRAPVTSISIAGLAFFCSGPIAEPLPGERVGLFEPFNPEVFGRFLAKVAHGAAVAELGLDAFEAFLPDVIRGKNKAISHYVGGSGSSAKPRAALHRVSLKTMDDLLVADIQIFSRYGLPRYHVVVGKLAGALAALHRHACISLPASSNLNYSVNSFSSIPLRSRAAEGRRLGEPTRRPAHAAGADRRLLPRAAPLLAKRVADRLPEGCHARGTW